MLQVRWERARRDPLAFLRWFCWTLDQHDTVTPVKPFPVDKPQIEPMVRLWQDNRLLSIVKCRQVVMTWLFSALSLWDCLFHRGRLSMMQSKRLEDAIGDETSGDGPLGRAKFMLHHIPAPSLLLPEYRRERDCKSERIQLRRQNSTLWAIPQGGAIIRQRTASGIFSDEAAFQPECSDAYIAARPTIRGGGWYVSLTTADLADGGHTRALHEDTLDQR